MHGNKLQQLGQKHNWKTHFVRSQARLWHCYDTRLIKVENLDNVKNKMSRWTEEFTILGPGGFPQASTGSCRRSIVSFTRAQRCQISCAVSNAAGSLVRWRFTELLGKVYDQPYRRSLGSLAVAFHCKAKSNSRELQVQLYIQYCLCRSGFCFSKLYTCKLM